jgi:surface antigen
MRPAHHAAYRPSSRRPSSCPRRRNLINLFRGGPGLSPEDNRLLFDSIAQLNAAEPAKAGRSEAWSNPQTNTSGTATYLRVFRSHGMACHLVRNHIVVAGQPPGRDYRLTWCRTPNGEWKIQA